MFKKETSTKLQYTRGPMWNYSFSQNIKTTCLILHVPVCVPDRNMDWGFLSKRPLAEYPLGLPSMVPSHPMNALLGWDLGCWWSPGHSLWLVCRVPSEMTERHWWGGTSSCWQWDSHRRDWIRLQKFRRGKLYKVTIQKATNPKLPWKPPHCNKMIIVNHLSVHPFSGVADGF